MKKKNAVLGVLLLAVVITSYSVSGTYAKYISKVGGTDDARVAEWSFNSKGDFDLFQESYTHGDDVQYVQSLTGCEKDEDGNIVPGTCDDVVAPGTKGEYSFQLVNGDFVSEVNYMLTMIIEGENTIRTEVPEFGDVLQLSSTGLVYSETTSADDGTTSTKNYYSPIKFKLLKGMGADQEVVNLSTEIGKTKEWTNNIDELVKAIKSAYFMFSSLDTVQGPNNSDIATTFLNPVYTIQWEWEYNNPTDETTTLISKYDTKIATESTADTDKKTISLTVDVTAEQTKCAVGTNVDDCKASADR